MGSISNVLEGENIMHFSPLKGNEIRILIGKSSSNVRNVAYQNFYSANGLQTPCLTLEAHP